MSLDDFYEEEVVEEKPKKKAKETIKANKVSGYKGGGAIIFRGDKKYKFRLVPFGSWNGGEEQEFGKKEFSDFDKPAFYKGE